MATDIELWEFLRESFKGINNELSRNTGITEGRLAVVERDIGEMKIRLAPVLRMYESELGPAAKLALLEKEVEQIKKDHDERINSLETQRWAVIGFALVSLITAVSTLLWFIIQNARVPAP